MRRRPAALAWLVARVRGEVPLSTLVRQGLELSPSAFVASHVYLDPGRPWLISIGDHATVAPFVVVLVHDASTRHRTRHTRIARVRIGKRTFIGSGSILLPGTTIGDGAIVAAGSVVRGWVPPDSIVAGNPAVVVGDANEHGDRHLERLASRPVWPATHSVHAGVSRPDRLQQRDALEGTDGYVEAGQGLDGPGTG